MARGRFYAEHIIVYSDGGEDFQVEICTTPDEAMEAYDAAIAGGFTIEYVTPPIPNVEENPA